MKNNKYSQKLIIFLNDSFTAIHNTKTNEVYCVIAEVCRNLGFDRRRINTQVTKITQDDFLKKGILKIKYLTRGGYQKVLCLNIDYLPLWLAKINIRTIKDKYVKQKLENYQLKAKDILSQAFLKMTYSDEKYIRLIDTFFKTENDTLLTMGQFAKLTYPTFKMGRNILFRFLRNHEILMSNGSDHNSPYQIYIGKKWFQIKHESKRFIQTFVTQKGEIELFNEICLILQEEKPKQIA